MPEILEKLSKTGDKFTAISDLQNNEKRVVRIGNSVQSFQSKFIVLRYPKNSCLKGQGYF